MAVKKTGLGKGLDAFFSTPIIEKEQQLESVTKLKLNEKEPNKGQARKKFDEESIEELANSIKEYGVIQPIIVTKIDNFYEIIAGERRWRASKKAGLDEIPVIIRENDEQKNKAISLIENIQREDLNPFEKALGIKNLMQSYGLTQEEVAKKLGKSRSSIANSVRVLNLEPRVLEFAKQGKITEAHCKLLLAITDPEKQYLTAVDIIERGTTTRELEQTNKKINKKEVSKEELKRMSILYKDIENTFQGFFGTKVKMAPGKKKGKIIIEYASNDDLERILNLMK